MQEEDKHVYDGPKVSQLSIFVGTNYLVTIHQSEVKPLAEMFQHCKSNDKERETSMGDSPGFLLHSILDTLVSDLFHRLTKIGGNLNDLEGHLRGLVKIALIFRFSTLSDLATIAISVLPLSVRAS
jgi:magnesium transporter